MSYEGYEQHICKNGHYYVSEPSGYYSDTPACPYCDAESAFCNSVDQTNGPSQGKLNYPEDFMHLLLAPAVADTCEHCGHTKLISETVYRIPTSEEMKPYRHYFDEEYTNDGYRELTREEMAVQEAEDVAKWVAYCEMVKDQF